MLVTRAAGRLDRARSTRPAPTRSTSPATTSRAWPRTSAYLRDADPVHGGARLGAVRVGPRGRHRAVRAQLEVRRRAHDRRPLHVLQDDDLARSRARYGAIATHMPKPFSRADRQRLALPLLALGRGGQRTSFLDADRPARPRPVAARVPLPRRADGARPGARRADRADRQLLQAALDRRLPDRRPLGLHLDAGVHHLRRQQPDAHVPDARSPAASSAASSRVRSTRTSGIAGFIAAGLDGIERELDPGEPMIGRNMYEIAARGGPREGIRYIPQSLSEALDEFEARRGRAVGARARSSRPSSCA